MAIKANIVSQKYYNQYRNGIDFSVNTSDYTRNLTGSVMEKIKVVTRYKLSWKFELTASVGAERPWSFVVNGNELSVIRKDGGDFREEGFAVGQSAYIGLSYLVYGETVCSILQISKDTIVLDMYGAIYSTNNNDIFGIRLMGDEPITALVYDFGLIENDENYNTVSKVTQNTQGYYGSSIGYDSGSGRSNSFVELNKLGKFNDFVTGSARCRFVERVKTETDIYQVFEFEHEFIINPWYLEGQISDLQNGILPEYLDGSASLKYVSNAEFREVLNNPNIVYPILEDSVLGSVAFFDESFNGFNNDYQVESISYKESSTLATADGILVTGKTKVTVEISNTTGVPIPSGERYGVYVSYLPKESQYKDIIQGTLIDNFIYDNVLNNEGYAPKSGSDFIKSTTATNNYNNLVITFDVEYSTIKKALLSQQLRNDNGNYIIGIQIGDNTLTSGNSDRVILKADVNTFDESPDIAGLSSITNFSLIPHNEEIGTSNYTSLKSWNEDGIIATFDYNLDLSKNAFLNELSFAILAYNSTTGDYFILDSFQVDLSGSQVSNGIQLIDVDTTRNYNLINESLNKKYYYFNGVDQYIDTNILFPYGNADVFTEVFDVEFLQDGVNSYIAGCLDGVNQPSYIIIRNAAGILRIQIGTSSGTYILVTDTTIPSNSEHQIGIIYEGLSMGAYEFKVSINGSFVSCTVLSDTSAGGQFLTTLSNRFIGTYSRKDVPTGFAKINLKRYSLYSVNLTESELTELYENSIYYSEGVIDSADIYMEYIFDNDATIAKCLDNSGNGRYGTPVDVTTTSLKSYVDSVVSEFNMLKVLTGDKVGDIQSYNCVYAQKITWQDWIQNLNVNSVFIDKTEPNNNQSLKASNYSNVNDYQIHLAVISNISGTSELGVSGQTNYLQLSPEIIVKDYDTSEEWSGEISTYRELNDEDLGGVVLSGENTIMKTVWTNSGGAVASLSGIWAIHRIEETEQERFNIDELSSLADYPISNKLIPIENESLLKVEIDSGNVVTTCLIDGSKINPSQSYNLSSRINKDETIENVKLTSPLGLIKETSGTVTNKTTSP